MDVSVYEAQIAERDDLIKALDAQVADAAKIAETAEQLKSQIEELRAQGESDRLDFELRLAECRNVKAARAVLEDHCGDVSALKKAAPWMFADSPKQQTGRTGFSNAGASTDTAKDIKHWRKIAELDINYMVLERSVVIKFDRHVASRIFSPPIARIMSSYLDAIRFLKVRKELYVTTVLP